MSRLKDPFAPRSDRLRSSRCYRTLNTLFISTQKFTWTFLEEFWHENCCKFSSEALWWDWSPFLGNGCFNHTKFQYRLFDDKSRIIAWSMLGITKVQAFVLDLVGITGFGDMRNRMAGRALQALDGRMGIQGVQRDLVLSLLYPTNAIMPPNWSLSSLAALLVQALNNWLR